MLQSRQRNGDVEASSVGRVMEVRAHDRRHSDARCWWICRRPSVSKRDDHMVHSVVPKGKSLKMRFLPPPRRLLVGFRVGVNEEEASFLGIGSLQLRIRKFTEVSGWVQGRWLIIAVHKNLLLVTPREVEASAHGAERELRRSVVPHEQSRRNNHHQRLNDDYQNEHYDEFPIMLPSQLMNSTPRPL